MPERAFVLRVGTKTEIMVRFYGCGIVERGSGNHGFSGIDRAEVFVHEIIRRAGFGR